MARQKPMFYAIYIFSDKCPHLGEIATFDSEDKALAQAVAWAKRYGGTHEDAGTIQKEINQYGYYRTNKYDEWSVTVGRVPEPGEPDLTADDDVDEEIDE